MIDWPEIARCFSVLRPARWIDPEARDFLTRLEESSKVLVACSGGADSIFLVLTTCSMLGKNRVQIAHFNHAVRGEESDADEQFVKEFAGALGISFYSSRLDKPQDQSEAAMREARYAWLVELYQQQDAAGVLLGHHADDLLETQLIALLSGSGPAGMSSPVPVRRFPDGHVRVRPLLPMKRATIEKTLESLGAKWREDSSNSDMGYTRNWIRRQIVPALTDHFPQDVYAGSARTRKLMRDAVDAADWAIEQLNLDFTDPTRINISNLRSVSPGIIRRVLFAWWMRHFGDHVLPTAAADSVIELIYSGRQGKPVSIGRIAPASQAVQCMLINQDGFLLIQPEAASQPEKWNGGCHWTVHAGPIYTPAGGRLSGEFIKWPKGDAPYQGADPAETAWLQGISGPIFVRQWQSGDRYRPLGAPGNRKLQDLFGDAKLNSEQKQALPVLLNSKSEILWVPGFPPAEYAKVHDGINSALRLTYRTL